MNNSPKTKGEKGQLITIGELAKWDIQIALPLSDNLPFDIILIYNKKLYKAQIKTSSRKNNNVEGSISFKLTTNNWHKKETYKYSKDDIDVMILCDYENIYLLSKDDFIDRSSFDIRKEISSNNQKKRINFHEDFIISKKRIYEVLI